MSASGCAGRDGLLEGIEVHDDEVDRVDPQSSEFVDMRRLLPVGEDPGMDMRVQRLDPPAQALGEAGQIGHLDDRDPGCPQRGRRRAGRDDADPTRDEGRANSVIPVLSKQLTRAVRTGVGSVLISAPRSSIGLGSDPGTSDCGVGDGRGLDDDCTPVLEVDLTGGECCHAAGQQTVLDRMQARTHRLDRVSGIHLQRLLREDRTMVDELVDQMHRHPGHADAGGERVLDRTRAAEGREQ
jgi:hypothetical protein